MSKRRTRKQKEKAKHQFTVEWRPASFSGDLEPKKGKSEPVVKGQTSQAQKHKKSKSTKQKKTNKLVINGSLGTIKRDLTKSLIIASFILALEVVLYLA